MASKQVRINEKALDMLNDLIPATYLNTSEKIIKLAELTRFRSDYFIKVYFDKLKNCYPDYIEIFDNLANFMNKIHWSFQFNQDPNIILEGESLSYIVHKRAEKTFKELNIKHWKNLTIAHL